MFRQIFSGFIFAFTCSLSTQSTVGVYDSGIRFESQLYPGWFIGFDEDLIKKNGSSTLYLIPDSIVTNKTLWYIEKKAECATQQGYIIRSLAFPQYYIISNDTSLWVEKEISPLCFKFVHKDSQKPGSWFTIELPKASVYSVVGLKEKNAVISTENSNNNEAWALKYNAQVETAGKCQKDGGDWGPWGEWTDCSTTCGQKGIQNRVRKCTNAGCLVELDIDVTSCNRVRCPVEADYYIDLWECLFYPQTDGNWGSWKDQVTLIDEQKCPGSLIYSTRRCDSPSPQFCGLACGENFIKIDIVPVCDAGYDIVGHLCFRKFSEGLSWSSAKQRCEQDGDILATVPNAEVNSLLKGYANDLGDLWIGLKRDETSRNLWKWTDGTEFVLGSSYSDWLAGEPNDITGTEDCVHIVNSGNFQWNDIICDQHLSFACQRDAHF